MKAITLFALCLPYALASPAILKRQTPSKVRIVGVSLLGSGCPAGTADVQIDRSNTLLEVTFSEYIVQTGPGTKASDWRKNCKLTLNMEFSSGYQFSTFSTDMMGFAQIPDGTNGYCSNAFDFTGGSQRVTYTLQLQGRREGSFSLRSNPDIESWSPCGGSTAIMNMNTQCYISPTSSQALIAVDRISGKLTVNIALRWRSCPK